MEIIVLKIVRVLMLISFLNDKFFGFEAMNITVPSFKSHRSHKTTNTAPRKWQEGKVTSKRYEIFNILWRKNNIFTASNERFPNVSVKHLTKKVVYNETSSHKYIKFRSQNKKSIVQTNSKLNMKPTTPSYIEFDYLDNVDNKINRKSTIKRNNNRTAGYKFAFLQAPFHLFRRDDATSKSTHNFHTSTFLIF